MSKEIIEKIAKDTGCPSRQPCEECLLFNECDRLLFALRLYNKNYREQSEGEWLTETGNWIYNVAKKYCSKCGTNARYDKHTHKYILTNFCPNCGAQMKGGAK